MVLQVQDRRQRDWSAVTGDEPDPEHLADVEVEDQFRLVEG